MNVLRALKNRSFALLWAGQTTSRLGDSLHRIALAWWVLEKTGSAFSLGYAICVLAGWGTDLLGAPAVFLVGGAGTILMILLGLLHPAVRGLD